MREGGEVKNITVSWLNENSACYKGVEWFKTCGEKDKVKVLEKLISEDKLDWANWLIVRVMSYEQYVSSAVYAAEQVIDIYEKKHSDDKRPREAIEAAKKVLKKDTKRNRDAAWSAADSAADSAARSAAWSAAWSAVSAASAARSAADSAAKDDIYDKCEKFILKRLEVEG